MDLQARFYDPALGRFFSIDPETEGQLEFSPYHYSFNNPIRFSDPDGRWPGDGPGFLSVTGNFARGLGQSAWGTATGVYGVVRHPINTAKAIGGAVGHPINTANAIKGAVSEGYNDFQNGNADVKANMAGKVIGDVAQLFVGAGEVKAALNGIRGAKVAEEAGQIAKVIDDVADATGFGPKATPIRMQGPWTQGDLMRASNGQGPLDFIPTVNKAGRKMPLELHHGDQMPGSAIHEVPPAHSGSVPHPNKFNQGVTPQMRTQDSQLHWYLRGLEMGNK